MGLSDGIMATMDFRDGKWQGYQVEEQLYAVLDLKENLEISKLSSNFYQYNNAWIFAPTQVEYFVSEDGASYTSVGNTKPKVTLKEKGKYIESMTIELEIPVKARFVKMVASSIGPCPDWHDAAGSPSWLFVDEFYVN